MVRTDTALVHDRGQHILDELWCLGELIEHDEDRPRTIDAALIVLADTEALVGQLAGDAVLTIKVRHPHAAVRQLCAVDGVNCNVVCKLGQLLECMEQRGLADAVLTLHDDGALVADSGDEVHGLSEGKICRHGM